MCVFSLSKAKIILFSIDKMIEANVQDYWPYMTHIPNIAKVDEGQSDSRPRLYDPQSKQLMLVDTCAQVSVWPKRDYPDAKINNGMALQAVNGSKIPTFTESEFRTT